MYNFNKLQTIIEVIIASISYPKKPVGLYEPYKYILDIGGKRIRPILLLAACNMFSKEITHAVSAAIGFEVFHNFTLLHDDVMDNSEMRRNKPTVHVKWDVNTAILSGDIMLIKAYDFIMESPTEYLKELLQVFNTTAAEVCEGQQFDMNFETQNDVSESEYIEMIRLKTSVLIAAVLKAGAILGGAKKSDAEHIYNFGINIGIAFQLQDDLLDVFGNVAVFGKKIGGDILEGKKTFLLINALKKSKDDTLLNIINDENINPEEKITKVTEIYNTHKIKELTLQKIEEYHKKGLAYLEKISVSKDKKYHLKEFSNKLMKRNF